MRAIMMAMAAAFAFSGVMATATVVRADDTTIIKHHDDGDKTVIHKKTDDVTGDKKVIIHKND